MAFLPNALQTAFILPQPQKFKLNHFSPFLISSAPSRGLVNQVESRLTTPRAVERTQRYLPSAVESERWEEKKQTPTQPPLMPAGGTTAVALQVENRPWSINRTRMSVLFSPRNSVRPPRQSSMRTSPSHLHSQSQCWLFAA